MRKAEPRAAPKIRRRQLGRTALGRESFSPDLLLRMLPQAAPRRRDGAHRPAEYGVALSLFCQLTATRYRSRLVALAGSAFGRNTNPRCPGRLRKGDYFNNSP